MLFAWPENYNLAYTDLVGYIYAKLSIVCYDLSLQCFVKSPRELYLKVVFQNSEGKNQHSSRLSIQYDTLYLHALRSWRKPA